MPKFLKNVNIKIDFIDSDSNHEREGGPSMDEPGPHPREPVNLILPAQGSCGLPGRSPSPT